MNILDQRTELVGVEDVAPHPQNPRQGDIGAIYESIKANGFYGAIIVQESTGYTLAGNHRYLAARQLGMKEVPAHVLDVDDDAALRILLVDNRTNDLASYDDSALADLLQDLYPNLEGTGYDGDDLDELLAELEEAGAGEDGGLGDKYARRVETPIYEPTGEQPAVTDLYDRSRAVELQEEIDRADIPEDVRAFLHAAAQRHAIFQYDKIAEYYAHAPAEVQRLMERATLVIIDFEEAIEQGFVKLHDDVRASFETDHPDA